MRLSQFIIEMACAWTRALFSSKERKKFFRRQYIYVCNQFATQAPQGVKTRINEAPESGLKRSIHLRQSLPLQIFFNDTLKRRGLIIIN